VARAEHISLESDHDYLREAVRSGRRKVRTSYALRSRLRGCETELSILEDHYLAVRSVRPHGEPKKYEFDLRFAQAKPVRVRHISWFWLGLALALALLGAGAIWTVSKPPTFNWLSPVLLSAIATLLAALGAMFMFLRRTTESLEFTSVHGEVTLVSVTGGIGSARGGKSFFVELIKNINAAKAARPQQRPQLLRDEMREHHRLRELGVLSEAQYAASKARILAAH
jgi:hypothetical protein